MTLHEIAMKTKCVEIVVAMIAMGARFRIQNGTVGAEAWTYELEDERARPDCRRLLAAADQHEVGFNSAFIAAIRKAGGAR